MGQFATLADVKAHLNSTSTANDDELTLMLDAAEERVRSLVGSFDAVAVTERVTAHGGTVLLSRKPVGAVVLNGGDVTGFVTSSSGVLYDVPYGYEPLTATYTAGDGVVPASVTLATAIIAAHLWETQRGTSPSALALQQPDGSGVDDSFLGRPSYAIPNRAKELLEPFLQSSAQIA